MTHRVWLCSLVAGYLVLFAGCGSGPAGQNDGGPGDGSCPAESQLAGECVGVQAAPLCDSDPCTDGVSCASVLEATDDASLEDALAKASPGTCIALAPGTYGRVESPPGVALLGRGASLVTLQGVVLESDASLRGVTVGGSGVRVADGAEGVRIVAVHIAGAGRQACSGDAECASGVCLGERGCQGFDALQVGAGASVEIIDSTLESAGIHGISAFDAAQVTVRSSLISSAQGPGLWAECGETCVASGGGQVVLERVLFRDNHLIGLALVGVTATLTHVRVEGTAPSPTSLEGGGGVGIWGGATVSATGLASVDNAGFGILVDGASARLGELGADEGVMVARNLFGVWLQNLPDGGEPQAVLRNAQVLDNRGVGIGLKGATGEALIEGGTEVSGTQMVAVPVLLDGNETGQELVGDGVAWLEGARATLTGLALSSNARTSILIDGAVGAGSLISSPQLSGGDEEKGIAYQRVEDPGSELPVVEGEVLVAETPKLLPVAVGPSTPTLP